MFLDTLRVGFRKLLLASSAMLAALALSGIPGAIAQQVDDAIVVGTVFDSSHATVSGAQVKLTHLATNAVTEVRTDERGEYRTPSLKIGEYAIAVVADGFKQSNQRGVVLEIGDVRKVDVVLEVGQTSESVVVEAEAPLLQSSDSTVGDVINNRQIEELPLNGRDYLQLANLSSGTVPSTQGVEIGGQAGTQVAFLLDGQDNNNQQISTSHSGQKEVVKPSVDAIQEFKVVTNGYSAEFGRSSSGVVSVALKSGSNELHGSAFEFIRNDIVDAKNLFATYKPPYKRNQFGSSAGGPVIRNKTFIFGDFEASYIRRVDHHAEHSADGGATRGSFFFDHHRPVHRNPVPGKSNSVQPAGSRLAEYSFVCPSAADRRGHQQLQLRQPGQRRQPSLGPARGSDHQRQAESFLPLQRSGIGHRGVVASAADTMVNTTRALGPRPPTARASYWDTTRSGRPPLSAPFGPAGTIWPGPIISPTNR